MILDMKTWLIYKEEETKKLFEFCDLKWDSNVFDFYKTAKTIRTVSINQVKKPIYQSILNSGLNFNIISIF